MCVSVRRPPPAGGGQQAEPFIASQRVHLVRGLRGQGAKAAIVGAAAKLRWLVYRERIPRGRRPRQGLDGGTPSEPGGRNQGSTVGPSQGSQTPLTSSG